MKFWKYLAISTALFGAMIIESLLLYPNYFSSLVGIPDSIIKACIVFNFAGCITVLWFKFVVLLFLGELNMREYQSVYQRGWVFLSNSLLFWGTTSVSYQTNAYNLGIGILAGLTLLVLHWACRSRISDLQAFDIANISSKSIIKTLRLAMLSAILLSIDIGLCQVAWERFRTPKFSLFLSIFLIDLTEMALSFCGELVVNVFAVIHLYRNEDEDEWERSALLLQAIHLFSSLTSTAVHAAIINSYGFMSSDFGSSVMRFCRLCQDANGLWKALSAKSGLEKFTIPATEGHLQRDNTCVICRDEMFIADTGHKRKAAKMLTCGHIMHAGCLTSWLARSENCPTCRQSVKSGESAFRTQMDQSEAAAIEELAPTNNIELGLPNESTFNLEDFVLQEGVRQHMHRQQPQQPQQRHDENQQDATQHPIVVSTDPMTPKDDMLANMKPMSVQMFDHRSGTLADKYFFTLKNFE